MALFIYAKYKQDRRASDRSKRLADKQQQMFEMLHKNSKNES